MRVGRDGQFSFDQLNRCMGIRVKIKMGAQLSEYPNTVILNLESCCAIVLSGFNEHVVTIRMVNDVIQHLSEAMMTNVEHIGWQIKFWGNKLAPDPKFILNRFNREAFFQKHLDNSQSIL